MEAFKRLIREKTILANGGVVANLKENEQQCPKCFRVYTFEMPRGEGEAYQREQWLSGLCSNECWINGK